MYAERQRNEQMEMNISKARGIVVRLVIVVNNLVVVVVL